jgi:hypothetical protein
LPSTSCLALGKEKQIFFLKILCLAPPAWRSAKLGKLPFYIAKYGSFAERQIHYGAVLH